MVGLAEPPPLSDGDARLREAGPDRIRGLAPAKVNLFLEVLGRRDDGFHELVTVMHEIDLADEITVALAPGGGADALELSGPPLDGDPAENLVLRTAREFRRRVPDLPPVAIRLHKAVPVGAGLGGGSADAAFVLQALQRLAGEPLDPGVLQSLAAALGSDVPFFLHGGTALCRGRGERVEPLRGPPLLRLQLVRPGFSLSTAEVYDRLVLTGEARDVTSFVMRLRRVVEGEALECHNRLETAAVAVQSRLRTLRDRLVRNTGSPWAVTGTGSVLFTALGGGRDSSSPWGRTPRMGTAGELFQARSFERNVPRA